MTALQRVTTEYVPLEDRIRLSGQPAADGAAPVLIWLTQRLLQRLLPVLLEWLERQDGGAARDDFARRRGGADGRANGHADLLRSFAQQAARAELAPQAPVRAAADSAAWLAREVDIGRHDGCVRLTWRGAERQCAYFELGAKPLRQWLGIVHDHYVKAEWPLDAWPGWAREAPRPAGPGAALLH